jgi:hypothetical protein
MWKMKAAYSFGVVLLAIAGTVCFHPWGLRAAESSKADEVKGREVDIFAGIDAGDIDVKFIAKNSKQANITIKNNTKEPLSVKLPEAFAGVPVLAQRRNGGGAGGNRNGVGQTQAVGGGGMGGMGGGGMGGGGGGGMFNVPAEKVAKFEAKTVCLEHGKAEPRAAIAYEIKPLDTVTEKPGVAEVCKMLSSGQISQRAAQAAAWHLANNMSWEELAGKKIEHADGFTEPYFSAEEVQAAMQLSSKAEALAAEKAKQNKPDSDSYSRYESPGEKLNSPLPLAK